MGFSERIDTILNWTEPVYPLAGQQSKQTYPGIRQLNKLKPSPPYNNVQNTALL